MPSPPTHTEQDNTYLIGQLMPALKADWLENQRAGRRPHQRYSKTNFQDRLYDRYPDRVRNSVLLKTVVQYLSTAEREGTEPSGVDEQKVDALIEFIYRDHSDMQWPRVTKLLREFRGGAYVSKLDPFLPAVTAREVQDVLDRGRLVEAGATPGEDYFSQLMQTLLLAKAEYEAKGRELLTLRAYKEKSESQSREIKELIGSLRERLAVLEYEMSRLESVPPALVETHRRMQNILSEYVD